VSNLLIAGFAALVITLESWCESRTRVNLIEIQFFSRAKFKQEEGRLEAGLLSVIRFERTGALSLS
jgi:hypothetical protein